jgi:ribosomal-protein-alanine N-acetyltransferase
MDGRLTFPNTFPVLQAGEWQLRELQASDAQALHAYLTDPEVTENTSYEIRTVRDVESLVQFYGHAFARHTDIRWGIVDRATGRLVGTCGLSAFHERHRRAELGYDLARESWGRGAATAVASAVLDYGFSEMGLNRIEAVVMTANSRSERVLEKLGFTREGVLRQYKHARGEWKDYTIHSVLQEEWLARNA